MDKTDLRIVEILQKNGRISLKDLGKEVGLTSPAVSERVKRLEENGVILGYKAIINPQKVNKHIQAFIHTSMERDKYNRFLEYANNISSIIECYHVTGGNSMILKVMVETMEQLEALIDDIKKIGNTQTSIILSSPIEDKIII
ncbi:MAG: Lrp/AsnC family transcriptional regulator [Anaeromicrobium sp.]|jgi:Lrp/AsnC family leucine-responsive transcriptional regulator|uniref:Lrp/AsnC family transcriptional regulator n=1 Tax=Anaeromicrobium sp. TaxID=1929132 RepID=UPI0025FC29E8|nr:Lrp/AsnC family transcriptional regulator [Anaeromicrobium sp.]MCT4595767.1 Lrp/AsnC family transcriptional regulator [Anaeromicrobium sp.]